jgi:hypothetical protein
MTREAAHLADRHCDGHHPCTTIGAERHQINETHTKCAGGSKNPSKKAMAACSTTR